MAKFDGKFFRGIIGSVSFRSRNGEQIAQSLPKKPAHQSAATKSCGAEFGLASAIGKAIRTGFSPILGGFKDGKMVNRLTRRVAEVIRTDTSREPGCREFTNGNLQLMAGFDFNAEAPLSRTLGLEPQAVLEGNLVKIALPALNRKAMKYPSDCDGCFIVIAVAVFDFEGNTHCHLKSEPLDWDIRKEDLEAQEWTFGMDLPQGAIVMAGLSMEYYTLKSGMYTKAHPQSTSAALLGAFRVENQMDMPTTDKLSDLSYETDWRSIDLGAQAHRFRVNQLIAVLQEGN